MKKRIYTLLSLALALCFGLGATLYIFFGIAQFQDKREAQKSISQKSGLFEIRVPLQDLKKANDKEIWYEGQLYDIASYTVRDDIAVVTVFHDEHEESLIKSITDSFDPDNKYTADNFVHLVKHRIHIPDDGKVLVSPHTLTRTINTKTSYHTPPVLNHPYPAFATVPTPPPDII